MTTTKMAKFLQDISTSSGGALLPDEQADCFFRLVMANGYWLASPEKNAAVGLDVNWNTAHN